MDYTRHIESKNVELRVDDTLIHCDNTTWQIRNIAATSVGKIVVPFNEPRPTFNDERPAFGLKPGPMLILALIGYLSGAGGANSQFLGIVLALAVVGGFVAVASATLKTETAEWEKRRDDYQRRLDRWTRMKENPLVLYALRLETNAGSKPLFYGLNPQSIAEASDAIQKAMKNEPVPHAITIETVNIGGEDSINNFGSDIYKQSLEPA